MNLSKLLKEKKSKPKGKVVTPMRTEEKERVDPKWVSTHVPYQSLSELETE